MKKIWMRKAPFIIAIGILGVSAFSWLVMTLWNNILPGVLHIGAITFWQAAGILLLSKILFSGFRRMHPMGGRRWKKQMFGQWQEMTDEEKQMFRGRMQYCYSRRANMDNAKDAAM